jgi:hypothetical protein
VSDKPAVASDCHIAEPLLDKLAKEGVWFYGVIAALAVEKAVEGFLHSLPTSWFFDPTHPRPYNPEEFVPGIGGHFLEAFRVVLLLIMGVRFYFGAVWLSEQHLKNRARHNVQPHDAWRRARYWRNDFVTGIFHFVLFFAWSLTVTVHNVHLRFFSSYFILLEVILLGDLLYPFKEFRSYIKRNLKTAARSLVTLSFLCIVWGPGGEPWAEVLALTFPLVESLWELRKFLQQTIAEHRSAQPSSAESEEIAAPPA